MNADSFICGKLDWIFLQDINQIIKLLTTLIVCQKLNLSTIVAEVMYLLINIVDGSNYEYVKFSSPLYWGLNQWLFPSSICRFFLFQSIVWFRNSQKIVQNTHHQFPKAKGDVFILLVLSTNSPYSVYYHIRQSNKSSRFRWWNQDMLSKNDFNH